MSNFDTEMNLNKICYTIISGYRYEKSLTKALKPHQLKVQEFMILNHLAFRNDQIVSSITKVLKIGNITYYLDTLEELGYVKRVLKTSARSSVFIQITKKGRNFIEKNKQALINTFLEEVKK